MADQSTGEAISFQGQDRSEAESFTAAVWKAAFIAGKDSQEDDGFISLPHVSRERRCGSKL